MTLQEIKKRFYPTPNLDTFGALSKEERAGTVATFSEYPLDVVNILSSEMHIQMNWKIDKPFWEEALTGVFDKENGPGFIEIMVGR
jgi:hypothetical protein